MKNLLNVLLIFCIAELVSEPAYAYIDPGTGSLVVQILVASLAVVLIFFKSLWANIKHFFTKCAKSTFKDENK